MGNFERLYYKLYITVKPLLKNCIYYNGLYIDLLGYYKFIYNKRIIQNLMLNNCSFSALLIFE